MSDRLVSAAYYEQQQQRLQQNQHYHHHQQQQQLSPMMASGMLATNKQQQQQQQQASAESSLHYQRLQEYSASGGRGIYDNRSGYYNSSGYGISHAYGSSYGSSGSHYGHNGSGSYFNPYYGSNSSSSGSHFEASLAARQRYAPYQNQHHHQQHAHHHPHSGMFTPAGQQLVPSSVLHYPPRNTPYQQQQLNGYDQSTPMPYSSSRSLPYSQTSYGSYNNGPHLPYQQQQLAASVPHRSSTPAPNRTVVPHYLEPLHLTRKTTTSVESGVSPNFNSVACGSGTNSASYASNASLPNDKSPPPQPPEGESTNVHSPATNDHTARLTTSPPLISATGTDSGISNCSTRARSDSSQSTPVYSSEYPVSMSVESASCVSYHCGADETERETSARSTSPLEMKVKREFESAVNDEEEDQTSTLVKHEPSSDDISQSTATSTSTPTTASNGDKTKPGTVTEKGQSQSNDENETKGGIETDANNEDETEPTLPPPPLDSKREIKLLTQTTSTTILPEDSGVDCKSRRVTSDEGNAASKLPSLSPICQRPTEIFNASSNWTPFGSYSPTLCTPRRQRTPPVPHNSPVGYGNSPAIPMPSLTPLLRVKSMAASGAATQKSTTPRTTMSIATNKSRIIECDLIPSKKSKRKSLQRAKGTNIGNSTESSNGSSSGLINSSGSSDGSPELQQESPIREEIRDIKPLPGFQQAFGSTEIGRFSETFLLTPENSLESDALQYEEYEQLQAQHHQMLQQQKHLHHQQQQQQQQSPPHYHNQQQQQQNASYGYYEASNSYEPPRPSNCGWSNYEAFHEYNRRVANHPARFGSSYQHYMAYERFMGAVDGSAGGYSRRGSHNRFGEIRCNGF